MIPKREKLLIRYGKKATRGAGSKERRQVPFVPTRRNARMTLCVSQVAGKREVVMLESSRGSRIRTLGLLEGMIANVLFGAVNRLFHIL